MNSQDTKNFRFGNHTDVGRVRHQNEDFFGYFDTINGHVFIVCDGMGGHNGGAMAAQTGVNSIRNYLHQQYSQDAQEVLVQAIQYANNQIYQLAQLNEQYRGMGTTCVALLIRGNIVYYAHVGDSRIYLYSDGKLKRLTKDHSFVQTMVDQGLITEEDAHFHPRRSELTKALGTQYRAEVEPGITPIQVFQDDTFILSSDGLHGLVPDYKILDVMKRDLGIQQKSMLLVEEANQAGGDDNITVQLVEFFQSPLKSMQEEQQKGISESNSFSLKNTRPDLDPREEKTSTGNHPKSHVSKTSTQKSKTQEHKNTRSSHGHGKSTKKENTGGIHLPEIFKGLNLPKNSAPLVILLMISLGITYVYFSSWRESLKNWVVGKETQVVNKSGIQIKGKGADSSIVNHVEKKVYNYVLEKSPFLKNMMQTYDKVNKTVEDVNQLKNKTITQINELKKTYDKGKKYFHQIGKGENIKDIAEEYGLNVQDILKANKLKSEKDLVKLDSLIIPLDKIPG